MKNDQANRTYSLKELCRLANVTERTVRYYKEEGLLPPSEGAGPQARYSHDFLLRLLFIRQLKSQYLPLSEIKRRLAAMPVSELESQLAAIEVREPDNDYLAEAEAYDEEEADAKRYLDRLLVKKPAPVATTQVPLPPPAAPKPAYAPPPASSAWPTPPAGWPVPASRPESAPKKQESYRLPPLPAEEGENWKRWQLAPGIEIQHQESTALSALDRARLEELLEEARRIFGL